MGFSRQEYWSRLPFPSLGDLPNPGTEHGSALQADALPSEPPGKSIYVHMCISIDKRVKGLWPGQCGNSGQGRVLESLPS